MDGSVFFSLLLVYEWDGVRGLQSHIRIQNHGNPPCGFTIGIMYSCLILKVEPCSLIEYFVTSGQDFHIKLNN